MKYDYSSFLPPDITLKFIKRPLITVEVFGTKGSGKFLALIDSGADCSLFNIEIAKNLGIELSRAKTVKFTGIIGDLSGYRVENIKIKIEDFEEPVKIPICFVDSENVSILLGQEGFFDKHKIKFEKDHNIFEVNPAKK